MNSSLSSFIGMYTKGKGSGFKTAGILIAVAMILTATVEAMFFLPIAVIVISIGIELVISITCLVIGWKKDETKKKKHTRRIK